MPVERVPLGGVEVPVFPDVSLDGLEVRDVDRLHLDDRQPELAVDDEDVRLLELLPDLREGGVAPEAE